MHIKVFALVALVSMFASAATHSYQNYCGRDLAATLARYCDSLVKRAAPSWPWLPRNSARSLGRGKRQVVSECCDKPCSIDELLLYCGN